MRTLGYVLHWWDFGKACNKICSTVVLQFIRLAQACTRTLASPGWQFTAARQAMQEVQQRSQQQVVVVIRIQKHMLGVPQDLSIDCQLG